VSPPSFKSRAPSHHRSFQRLMLHGICQYLGLESSSECNAMCPLLNCASHLLPLSLSLSLSLSLALSLAPCGRGLCGLGSVLFCLRPSMQAYPDAGETVTGTRMTTVKHPHPEMGFVRWVTLCVCVYVCVFNRFSCVFHIHCSRCSDPMYCCPRLLALSTRE
jgi:hypothetical protein